MGSVEVYQALEKVLRDFVLHRVFLHHEQGWLTDYPMTDAEMDGLLKDLDRARFSGDEKDTDEARQTDEKEGHTEDELKDMQRQLLGNMGQFMPFLGMAVLAPSLRKIGRAMLRSAQADLVRAIVDCERMIEEHPGMDLERGNRLIEYKQRIMELEASLVMGLRKSEKRVLRETLKKLAGCNLAEEQGVFKIYLTKAYFEELMAALEKAGHDMTSWRAFFESATERLRAEDKEQECRSA